MTSTTDATTDQRGDLTITITIPPGATNSDLITVRGALFDASTTFVDFEKLHAGQPDAISAPGRVLLALADSLRTLHNREVRR